jgi:hypothetical protein
VTGGASGVAASFVSATAVKGAGEGASATAAVTASVAEIGAGVAAGGSGGVAALDVSVCPDMAVTGVAVVTDGSR